MSDTTSAETTPGAAPATAAPEPGTPFHDLDAYVALPRVTALAASRTGDRLVVATATLNPKRTKYLSALWDVDPEGRRPARRLTRGSEGESSPAFLPDGSVLFTSSRHDPDAESKDEDPPSALWLLPADGGEARIVGTRPGGFGTLVVARDAGTVVVASPTMPGATDAQDDERRRKARKDSKVSAILHETYPIRSWDHDLGPDRNRLLVAAAPDPAAGGWDGDARLELRDVTGHVGSALGDESSFDVTADGSRAVVAWARPIAAGDEELAIVSVDLASGERRVLLADPDQYYTSPVVSPDGTRAVVNRQTLPGRSEPLDSKLGVLDLATGEFQVVAEKWDRWPADRPVWTPDGRALIVSADEGGSSPVFRISVEDGTVQRLTADRGSYTSVRISADGKRLFALRATIDEPMTPVRIDLPEDPTAAAAVVELPGPAQRPALPGGLAEVHGTAEDGTPLRAWLALPEGASADTPAPLLLWIHGGPLHSWNAWSWRWNPWLAVARGYAVLLPDPALSTGYGLDFIRRGWGRWGFESYTDLMRITDAALERPDLDPARTAAMGGSYGGYMANWVAGHTDRFRAIVTHASLWALEQFGPTTDGYNYWRREMTPDMEKLNSPHLFIDKIVTPMLVIHGDRDYRVPIGEALRLWAELAEQYAGDDGTMPHKFLYFPNENHWILTPQHAKVWYQTVFAFLDVHLHGKDWTVPEILQ